MNLLLILIISFPSSERSCEDLSEAVEAFKFLQEKHRDFGVHNGICIVAMKNKKCMSGQATEV